MTYDWTPRGPGAPGGTSTRSSSHLILNTTQESGDWHPPGSHRQTQGFRTVCRPPASRPLTCSSFSKAAGSRSPVALKSKTRTSGPLLQGRGAGSEGAAHSPNPVPALPHDPAPPHGPAPPFPKIPPLPVSPPRPYPIPAPHPLGLSRPCSAWRNQRTQACTLLGVCAPSRYQVRGPRRSTCVRPSHSVFRSPGGGQQGSPPGPLPSPSSTPHTHC